MNARLVAIAGPCEGMSFVLDSGEMTIGRDPSNELSIPDDMASRKHCLIKREKDQFKILDLDSRNGTFINDIPTRESPLKQGDRIEIGRSLLLFLVEEEEPSPIPFQAEPDQDLLGPRSTIELKLQDAVYLKCHETELDRGISPHLAHGLIALLQFSSVINSIRSLEELEHKLVEFAFQMIPAQRAALLIVQPAGDLSCDYSFDQSSRSDKPFPISQTVVNRVLKERIGVLFNMSGDDSLSGAKSLVSGKIQSLISVPLSFVDKTLGILYLDTTMLGVSFEENHLQIVTAAAAIASVALENIRQLTWLRSENERLQSDLDLGHNIVGESQPMQEVFRLISKVSRSDSTVLITGESGTGKELVARAIHQNSSRSQRPFIAINCAALPETLLESELFGYEKGAFSGAISRKQGKFEIADQGTVFLDEIGEMPPALQAKLLRVLQEHEFDKLGGSRTVQVDIRFLSATNKNLEEAIKNGSFREDLYYRLNVVSVKMPSLRERREDVPLLAAYFAAKHSKRSKRGPIGISPAVRAILMNHDWPGNVRELENAIERAIVLGTVDEILPEDLPEYLLDSQQLKGVEVVHYYQALQEAKKQIILNAVQAAKGNYTEAAKSLGIHPNNLHRLIRTLELKSKVKEVMSDD